MQHSDKGPRKPTLTSQSKPIGQSMDKKLQKIQIFYRYHVASMYRQLKTPIYEKLLQLKKQKKPEHLPQITKSIQQSVQALYKYAALNSKYRHREKVRFERTPLLKYIQCNSSRMKLKEKLQNKKYMKLYDDLEDDDSQDEGPEAKKEYEKDPSFSEQSILAYKKKHNITGKICIALGYEDLKASLVDEFGWSQNPDRSSLIYDLKFMSKKKDLDYVNLLDHQYINHFQENKSITAKFGLTRNIRNLASVGRDPSLIFPRCYDVNDVAQLQDFYEDFKISQLKSYLIKFISSKGEIFKEQARLMKTVIQILSKELLPPQKKVDLISKGKRLFISHEQWVQLRRWNEYQKGETIFQQNLLNDGMKLFEDMKSVDPQWSLNKENIWIVKPASMSRGRGIKTFNDIHEMFEYIVGYEISWVAQKYIERPLIIKKKKFDIRQWALWTDFKPLRVWMYEQCYIRFCAEAYTPQNLKNRKIHLTNNSVTKGVNSENDGIEQNMMNEEQFGLELQTLYGKQVFNSTIKPQMRKIIVDSLQSVVENVQYRKNSFEIFGYDFMVDEELKVWLIEVNSSPTMEYSTKVTTKLVQFGMHDLALMIQNYIMKGKQLKDSKNKQQLYGGWRLLKQH